MLLHKCCAILFWHTMMKNYLMILKLQIFEYRIMLSHEINFTKYVRYFFERYFHLGELELIKYITKIVSRYLTETKL